MKLPFQMFRSDRSRRRKEAETLRLETPPPPYVGGYGRSALLVALLFVRQHLMPVRS